MYMEKVRKLYQVNVVCSDTGSKNKNICFFFVYYNYYNYKISKEACEFRSTKSFPLHWKKRLSKKLIDNLLTLEYHYWFFTSYSFDHIEDIKVILREKICDRLTTYPPISINIREHNV